MNIKTNQSVHKSQAQLLARVTFLSVLSVQSFRCLMNAAKQFSFQCIAILKIDQFSST